MVTEARQSDLAVDLLAAAATGWCLSLLKRVPEAETLLIEVSQSAKSAGDSFARCWIRLQEVREAIKLVVQLCDGPLVLPDVLEKLLATGTGSHPFQG